MKYPLTNAQKVMLAKLENDLSRIVAGSTWMHEHEGDDEYRQVQKLLEANANVDAEAIACAIEAMGYRVNVAERVLAWLAEYPIGGLGYYASEHRDDTTWAYYLRDS